MENPSADVRPIFAHPVVNAIQRELRAEAAQGVGNAALLGRIVVIGNRSSQRHPDEVGGIKRPVSNVVLCHKRAAEGIACPLEWVSLAQSEIARILPQDAVPPLFS